MGEREGRVFSKLVSKRHFHLAHGIGRSGDISETQPKAAGSSLLLQLCTSLASQTLKLSGISNATCLLLPVATGMSLSLVLMALKSNYPSRYKVVWPRIDQKSCFKSIYLAGCSPIVVENLLEGDELRTDVPAIERILKEGGEDILCVLTTTSCFAPRAPDKLVEVSELCKKYDICHVANNAYGMQSSKTTYLISEACRRGRLDAFVQSMDKNLMVPVGGAIVASTQNEQLIDDVSKCYPGRASASPIIDLFITLLSMGANTYKSLLNQRKVIIFFIGDFR